MKLDKTTAVITGGASGLGAASARELAGAGVRAAIFDRDAEKGEALAKEVGGLFCRADVTDEASVDQAFARARAQLGQERILINCAGIGAAVKTAARDRQSGEIRPHPIEIFSRVIAVNLIGTFRCLAKAAAGMMSLDPLTPDGGRGVVINTGSIAAQDGQIGQTAYAASKNGIVGLTLPAARDLAREGIRVCTILPGLFDTPALCRGPGGASKKRWAPPVPFPARLGYPEEYAQLARHICENDMLNGETIRLDGALRMAPR